MANIYFSGLSTSDKKELYSNWHADKMGSDKTPEELQKWCKSQATDMCINSAYVIDFIKETFKVNI